MVERFTRHVRTLWPGSGILAPLPFMLYSVYVLFVRGEWRWEWAVFFLLAPSLAYASPRTKRLFLAVAPLGVVGVLYDSMRYVKDVGVTAAGVHDCDLHDLDAKLFGVSMDGVRVAIPDYFHAHPHTALDLIACIPYGTFLFVTVGYAFYLYRRDVAAVERLSWTFLVVNVAGFLTYHLYPAAPPWYFHAHGCVVDLATRASEGPRLAHADAILGISYFHGMYGRSSDIFGAMPSLHVAYPTIILLEAWRHHGALGRSLALGFLVWMASSAVYLDHHWVLDVVAGFLYTCTAYTLVTFVRARRGSGGADVSLPLAPREQEAP